MTSRDPFTDVVERLDLASAAVNGSRSNDLLPRRAEDRVGQEVGRRFSDSLNRLLIEGRYSPSPASIVLVPKPSHTTRPAALMTLQDRTVYEALVVRLRSRIEESLLSERVVLWP